MLIKAREQFRDTYQHFNALLLAFQEQTYFPEKKDIDTIVQDVQKSSSEQIQMTIEQAEQVIKLKPFPHEIISEIANKYPFNKSHESTAKDYYEWIQWMIVELKKEVKKQK